MTTTSSRIYIKPSRLTDELNKKQSVHPKMKTRERVIVLSFVFSALLKISFGLDCYQCSGSNSDEPFQCNEWLSSDIDIRPEPCDNVYGAKYCIKHIGRFEASAILCYQCSASESLDCSDGMIHMGAMQPQSCEHVFEAQYCVKSTGLDGGIGAKRFCSSLDLGNYCNYVQQPGDILTYRTCVYTCTGDGCNPSNTVKPNYILMTTATVLIISMVYQIFC